ncbi:hypothetical protein LSAT2_011416, partial [Lamellibrachia satsuma]
MCAYWRQHVPRTHQAPVCHSLCTCSGNDIAVGLVVGYLEWSVTGRGY